MNLGDIRAGLEALIFVSPEPVSAKVLAEIVGLPETTVRHLVADLIEEYRAARRGIQIVEAAGGYLFLTNPEYAELVEKLARLPRPSPLSPAAIETLAIIAYRQPITRAEIEYLRGVKVDSALNTLLERNLIEEVGRREGPGRPILYGTTKEFLRYFGLRDLSELPPLEEFTKKEEDNQCVESSG